MSQSLNRPPFTPSRDLFVNDDWPNRTQTALFEFLSFAAEDVNSFKPYILSEILKIYSFAIRVEAQKTYTTLPLQSLSFTRWVNFLQV